MMIIPSIMVTFYSNTCPQVNEKIIIQLKFQLLIKTKMSKIDELSCFKTLISVLDLGLISIASLEPRASTKVESHVNFTESQKV